MKRLVRASSVGELDEERYLHTLIGDLQSAGLPITDMQVRPGGRFVRIEYHQSGTPRSVLMLKSSLSWDFNQLDADIATVQSVLRA